MNANANPSLQFRGLTTTFTYDTHRFECAMRMGLLAEAHAQDDATFTICRDLRVTVCRDATQLLDELAQRSSWRSLRVGNNILLIRADGIYGSISAGGRAEHCTVEVELWADSPARMRDIETLFLAVLNPHCVNDVSFSLNWRFMTGKGEVTKASTEEQVTGDLVDEAYPALGNVVDFIRHFLSAPESVLVLQGTPGTGKTRLIRAILTELSRRKGETAEVLYTGDTAVLDSDEVYVEFITGEQDAFVVEDADHLLMPRSEGNQTLHRFLNIADGIAQARGRKIIFSTNLPNARDIDDALLRPGRCFAHVHLQALQSVEARRLLEHLCAGNLEHVTLAWRHLEQAGRHTHSVAEVYAAHRKAVAPQADARVLRLGVTPQRRVFGFAAELPQTGTGK